MLTDANAQNTADSLKNLIEQGASFSKLAESFSQDPGSASSGGDWVGSQKEEWWLSLMMHVLVVSVGNCK